MDFFFVFDGYNNIWKYMLGGIASCIEKYNVIVEGVERVRNW